MFDFRYHVASLAAVFVALVIGILVGVGLSGRGFIDDAERRNLNTRIADLERQVVDRNGRLETVGRTQSALDDYVSKTYPMLVPGRLEGRKVVVLFVGSIDPRVSLAADRAVRDAGGTVIRLRAIRVPVDAQAVKEALRRRQGLVTLTGPDSMADVGAQLARELVTGGRMPVWEALAGTLVEERDGVSTAAADAVVVARPVDPQRGATRKLLASLYETLSGTGIAAVGVDREGRVPSSIGAFQAAGLSTVDSVNTAAGRLALVLLLAGADPGNYGVEESAGDGILPPVAPSNTRP